MNSEIQFFGKVDRNEKGKIVSQVPAWAMETHLDELRESIASKKRYLDKGLIEPSEIPYAKAEIKREEKRLEEIEVSRPKISSKDKDELASAHKELGEKIGESFFSRDEMTKGLANPGEEARRMINPIIKVDPKLAEACGVRHDKGMVSRNGASKIFKIIGKAIGERTNTEYLRPDRR